MWDENDFLDLLMITQNYEHFKLRKRRIEVLERELDVRNSIRDVEDIVTRFCSRDTDTFSGLFWATCGTVRLPWLLFKIMKNLLRYTYARRLHRITAISCETIESMVDRLVPQD